MGKRKQKENPMQALNDRAVEEVIFNVKRKVPNVTKDEIEDIIKPMRNGFFIFELQDIIDHVTSVRSFYRGRKLESK